MLRSYNEKTIFPAKHLKNETIIPHITHHIWLTDPKNPRVLDKENVWNFVKQMQADKSADWKHIFWTNHLQSIKLSKEMWEICNYNCESRSIWDLPDLDEIKPTLD